MGTIYNGYVHVRDAAASRWYEVARVELPKHYDLIIDLEERGGASCRITDAKAYELFPFNDGLRNDHEIARLWVPAPIVAAALATGERTPWMSALKALVDALPASHVLFTSDQ